jgi:hypothetical protein
LLRKDAARPNKTKETHARLAKKQRYLSKSFKNYLGFDNFRKELASFLFDCVLTFLRRLLSLSKIQRMRLEQ